MDRLFSLFFGAATLLFAVSLSAATSPADGARRSVFAYMPEHSLSSQVRYRQDIIILRDGTLLRCELKGLPELQYQFGKLSLKPSEVLLISSEGSKWNVYSTHGLDFRATPSSNGFTVLEHIPSFSGAVSKQGRMVSTEDVLLIVSQPKESPVAATAFSLTFKNGDVLPVDIAERELVIYEGKKRERLKTKDILYASFNGGLQGVVLGNDGNRREMGVKFVENPYISLVVRSVSGTLHLPWGHIDSIRSAGYTPEPDPVFISTAGEFAIPEIAFETPPAPLLNSLSPSDIPDVAFHNEVPPLLEEFRNGEIPDIAFLPDPAPLLAGVETALPTIAFLQEPKPVLAESEGFSIPEIDFQAAPRPLLADTSAISVPDVDFTAQPPVNIIAAGSISNSIDDEDLIAVGEDLDLEEDAGVNPDLQADEDEILFSKAAARPRQPGSLQDGALRSINLEKIEEAPLISKADYSHQKYRISSGKPDKASKSGMVYVSFEDNEQASFYIKATKVTNSDYQKFVKAVNYEPPPHWGEGGPPQGEENEPVVNVSYKDALLYSVWVGKRLPTEEEISYAARKREVVDLDDTHNEWTATPHSFDMRARDPDAYRSAKLGGKFASGRVIFGSSSPGPMRNHEYNSRTGFRVASSRRQ